LWVAVALAGGCTRTPATHEGAPRDWSAHPAVVTLTGAQEIDALGDVHGDADATFHMLAVAGLVTATAPPHWSGGAKILVVTGDVIDKGTSALPIITFLRALEPEARAAGGRVVVTLGNHEAEFLADASDPKSAVFQTELRDAGLDPAAVAAGETSFGAWLRELPVAALVDDWFFCHSGDSDGRSATAIAKKFRSSVEGPAGFGDDFLIGMGSILEANAWWQVAGAAAAIDVSLAALPAKHIVFGHDPGALDFPEDPQGSRETGEPASRYAGRLFLIDVGMSYAVGYSRGALLRITRGATTNVTALYLDGTSKALWP
jgi:hypothetical protein